MADNFKYDVFLSHSPQDKAAVRTIAERLREDGLRVWLNEWELHPGDDIPSKIEEGLEHSRALVLCMSAHAFGSDWAQLEANTFRFRDPLNKERRFILLRLDVAPIKDSLTQFRYINWLSDDPEQEYAKLLEACRPPALPPGAEVEAAQRQIAEKVVHLGSEPGIYTYAFSPDGKRALSGSSDNTMRLWDVETGRCLRVLEGHTGPVESVAWSSDQRRAFVSDFKGGIHVWDLSEFVNEAGAAKVHETTFPPTPEQVQYTNAKVLLVGETSAGKTGLAHRLATGEWKPSEASTVGAWSTQWKLKDGGGTPGVEQEIWLWDFGGQADQRLIHQLYMDRTSLILLLINADQEDVLPGLRDWQTALSRCVPKETRQFLVAGRIDTGFKASRGKLQRFARENHLDYHETSSLAGIGCEELHAAILSAIPWADIPVITTEQLLSASRTRF